MKLAQPMGMKLGALLAILLVSSPALAKRKDKKPKPQPQPQTQTQTQTRTETQTTAAPTEPKQPKVKVYSFTGLDVEGKLKTPQLLYFLNRIKAEFDTSTLDKRSFMPELEASADDKAL
jgi:hypothetical protein